MRIVVIGGTGLIGKTLVDRLRHGGHEATAASPGSGLDAVPGEGFAAALLGAQAVVDVADPPSEGSDRSLLAAAVAAGAQHHVALSMVGVDRPHANGHFRAKLAKEFLIRAAGLPYTILRATQVFEVIASIIEAAAQGDAVHLSPALVQPVASEDVAAALAELVVGPPLNGIVELAGPDALPLDKLARKYMAAHGDPRQVVADIHARFFGAELNDRSLTPGPSPRIGATRFADWLDRSSQQVSPRR